MIFSEKDGMLLACTIADVSLSFFKFVMPA